MITDAVEIETISKAQWGEIKGLNTNSETVVDTSE